MEMEMSMKSTLELQPTDTYQDNDASIANREWARRLVKFGDNSSFSAVVYEFKSKSVIKRFLWAMIILLAIGGFCYITSESIKRLVEEPISTSITESRQAELDFPAVTICSLSFLNTTTLDEFGSGFRYNITSELEELFQYVQMSPPDLNGCNAIAAEIVDNTGYQDGFSKLITELARNDPSELILKCTFEGKDCINDLHAINTVSGVCFTFNGPHSGSVRKAQGAGNRHGLRLELLIGDQYFSLNNNYGYNVIVHNRDEPPRPESEGIVVGLASNLYIGMKEVTLVDKTRFYSGQNCIEAGKNYSDIILNANFSFSGYNTSYSSSLCLDDCFHSHVADKCQCLERDFYDIRASSAYAGMRSCNTMDLCCELVAFDTFNATCNCPLKCKNVDYALTTSSATHSYDNRVGINVYFETLVSQVHETTDSYTPLSLISDIGGNTGLFLGFTLLTVGEVMLLVLALITDCCCPSCKKRYRADRMYKEDSSV